MKFFYASMMQAQLHGGVSHSTSAARPPVAPPAPQNQSTKAGEEPPAGTTALQNPSQAGFFVMGFGQPFFEANAPKMGTNGPEQGGFGMMGTTGMLPPSPQMNISSTDLKHCGFKKGVENTLNVGDTTITDKGHGQLQVKGSEGNFFTVDVNRCSAPPQIEIHAQGDKGKKALMKVPLKDLQKGGSITLPDGTQLNMKANSKGNNIDSFQVVTTGGDVATMSNYSKGNAAWKSGGSAMKIEGPTLSAGGNFDAITKGGAKPTPGQVAQGNANHLAPINNFLQPQTVTGNQLAQMPANAQQAQSQMQIMQQMYDMLQQLSSMYNFTQQNPMMNRIPVR